MRIFKREIDLKGSIDYRIRKQILAIRNLRNSAYKSSDTVLLAGSPRSGTTWIGKVLSAPRAYAMITEPIVPTRPDLREAGIGWRTYIRPNCDWVKGKRVFEDIFCGKNMPLETFRDSSYADLLLSEALLIKCIRANRLLPWIIAHFRLKGTIYLIRHPCAVVSSQLLHSSFPDNRRIPDYDQHFVEENIPTLVPFLKRLNREEEWRAVTWSLDQYVPLRYSKPRDYILLSYEELVMDDVRELRRVLSLLHLPMSDKSISQLKVPSREAMAWSANHKRGSVEERVSGWKHCLDRAQIKRVLDVVKTFGIEGFSDDPFPDVDSIKVAT
jgi:hypothetical protein